MKKKKPLKSANAEQNLEIELDNDVESVRLFTSLKGVLDKDEKCKSVEINFNSNYDKSEIFIVGTDAIHLYGIAKNIFKSTEYKKEAKFILRNGTLDKDGELPHGTFEIEKEWKPGQAI